MSGDIQVGEYIRTKEGYINKVKDERDVKYLRKHSENISKHSFNIKDLIEEGDLVNGYIVQSIRNFNGVTCYLLDTWKEFLEVESIVTHEQLENITYKVEG